MSACDVPTICGVCPAGSLALFFAADPRRLRSAYSLLPGTDVSSLLAATPHAADGDHQQAEGDPGVDPTTTLLYRPHHVAVAVNAKGRSTGEGLIYPYVQHVAGSAVSTWAVLKCPRHIR